MSDPRPAGSAASIAGAVGAFLLLSIAAPVVIALVGLLKSLSFFGEQPSTAERAETSVWLWIAVAVAAVSAAIIVVLAVTRGERSGRGALVVVSVLAMLVLGFWVVVASAAQPNTAQSTAGVDSSPSAAPTIAGGRFIPDADGTAVADELIERLSSTVFPVDAGPRDVARLVAAAGAENPEVQGAGGDVAVGVFVGHRTCVLGTVRAGVADWAVAGLSTDGGCVGPHHA